MELPTGVLAYRLLKSVDKHLGSEDKQQFTIVTMSSFTYDDMKKQLKAIYDNLSTNEIKGSIAEIKLEPTYEVKTYEKSDRLEGYFSRGQSKVEEVEDVVIIDLRKITKPVIQVENLVIHEE